jgi:prepilin-type N-terminal cleavage/methylation domain-containing protein
VKVRPYLRRTHEGERGVTLIELLVTIAIMALSFVALIAAFSTVELQVGTTSDDAQLTTLARQVTDVIETQSAQGGIAYVLCSSSGGTTYQTELNSAGLTTGTDTVTVVTVAQAQASGSSHVVSPNPAPVALNPISNCGGSGQSTTPDFGVQQLTFRVSSTLGHSLVRIVYKRWN